jgi:hypothetical protein
MANGATTRALAAQRLALIETKLKELTMLRDALAALVQECDDRGGSSCPILTRLSREDDPIARDATSSRRSATRRFDN